MGQRARWSVRLSSAGVGRVDVAVRASPRRVRPAWPITGVPNAPGLDGVRGVAVVAVLAYHIDLAWTRRRIPRRRGVLRPQRLPDHPAHRRRAVPHRAGSTPGRSPRRGRGGCCPRWSRASSPRSPCSPGWRPTAGLRADGLASLLYVQNWHLVVAGLPYSEAFARPSPLLHLWSLSVEGQLYLLWPLLLVGVLATARRSTALLVTVLLAFASALLMALRYDPDGGSLAYYATDARASGFLVGAALAWVWRPPAWSAPLPSVARWGIDAAGITALVTLVVGFVAVSEFDEGLYQQGGFLRVGLLAAVVIVAATRSRRGGGRAAVPAADRRRRAAVVRALPLSLAGLRARPRAAAPPVEDQPAGSARDGRRRGGVLPVDRDPRAARGVGSADGQAAAARPAARHRVRRGDVRPPRHGDRAHGARAGHRPRRGVGRGREPGAGRRARRGGGPGCPAVRRRGGRRRA